MAIFVIGGTGFIGQRVIRLLAARGEEIVCMDINPGTASFDDLGKQVRVMRGDVTQFDDVVAATFSAKPSRIINLSYFLGSEHAPHIATKLNIIGMDNCFEAARLAGVNRVVFASSLAVNGMQKHYGDRMITEDDFRHGEVQYAMHKIFNEWQAQDYNEKYGMTITAIRPANVTGPDKVRGSVDHVNIITQPAQGKPISLPHKDAMRCPIHVDDIAEVFTRVLLSDKPKHSIYNSGGVAISLGDIADIVREFVPDAQITFQHETGGKEISGNYLIDNTRLVQEFGVQYLPYRQRVLQIVNDIRRQVGLPTVSGNMTRLIAIAMALLVVATANAQDTVDWSKAEPVSLLLMENQIVPDRLTLQHGVPYVLQLENAGTERHRFTAAEFLAAAIVREPRLLTDDGSEVVLQPAVAIDLYLVPTRSGTYPLSCADHDLDGMIGEIVVE